MCAILSCCRGKASIISMARAAPRAGAWQTALTCMSARTWKTGKAPSRSSTTTALSGRTANIGAPEVHVIDGAFYMFASFHSPDRRRGTQILRAEKPTGPFVPISDGPVTPADWECLDGTFFRSKDGDPYLVFCHEWLQVHDGEVCAMKLTPDLKAAAGEPRVLFRASQAPWVVPSVDKDGNKNCVTDGPWLHRCPDGRLMMLWSSPRQGRLCPGGRLFRQRRHHRKLDAGRRADLRPRRRPRHDLPRFRGRAAPGAACAERKPV